MSRPMMSPWLNKAGLSLPGAFLVAGLLAGCGVEHHDEPWINPGQAERLGERDQRDEQTLQQLRDRARSGQAQR